MKHMRLALLLILPLFLLSIQGCTSKTYIYVFSEEQNLARVDGDWYAVNDNYAFNQLGLILDNCLIFAPHYYTGDLDVTVTFKSNSEAAYAGSLTVALSTGRELYGNDWYGGISIFRANADDAMMNSTYNDSGKGYEIIDDSVPCGDKLFKNGINVLKLTKKGSTLKFLLNGKSVGSTMNILGNTTDFNIPCLYSGGFDGTAPLVVKSIEVKFYGDQFPIE